MSQTFESGSAVASAPSMFSLTAAGEQSCGSWRSIGVLQGSPEQRGYQAGHKHFSTQRFLCIGAQGCREPAGFGGALSQRRGGTVLSIDEILGEVMWEVGIERNQVLKAILEGFCCHSASTLINGFSI